MATPIIGTYTEKKTATQINNLIKRITELESYIKTPPFIMIYGVMDIPSEFSKNWKDHVTYILHVNKINPNWILDTTNPHVNTECPYFVTIRFISHCVRDAVFITLSSYIVNNNFDGVFITKESM